MKNIEKINHEKNLITKPKTESSALSQEVKNKILSKYKK